MNLALLLLLAGMPVGESAPPSATPTTREPMSPGERAALIKESIADGIAARRRGDHERAYRYFRLANDVAQPPTLQTLSQLGLAECSVHKWAEAEKHLTEAIGMIKVATLGPEKKTRQSPFWRKKLLRSRCPQRSLSAWDSSVSGSRQPRLGHSCCVTMASICAGASFSAWGPP
jgi:hypothetical protein